MAGRRRNRNKNKGGPAARNNRTMPSRPSQDRTNTYTSNGAVGVTSFGTGNYFITLTEVGNPYDASQDGRYNIGDVCLDMTKFFSLTSLGLYEYYRVKSVETTFIWKSAPEVGPIMGELHYVMDNDSRESLTNCKFICNRAGVKNRLFSNVNQAFTVRYRPYLIETNATEGQSGVQVDYVQPRDRWLNCYEVKNHRFGTLRYVLTTPNKGQQYNNPVAVAVRSRVTIEVRGLTSLQ